MNQRKHNWQNNEDSDGDTPLHFAAALGKHSLLFKYLNYNYEINSVNKLGWTPLMQACINGHESCVRTLLHFGANVLFKNRFGICALSLAAASGHLEIVRMILNSLTTSGVPICEIKKYISPIILAILFNYINIVRYFIKKTFDFTRLSPLTGLTAIDTAIILNQKEIMALLKRRGVSPMGIPINYAARKSITNSPIIISATPSPVYKVRNSLIPSFIVCSSPVPSPPVTLKTPASDKSTLSLLSPKQIRKQRKNSNNSLKSVHTPSLSPISIGGSSGFNSSINSISFMDANTWNSSNQSSLGILNKKFSISPRRLRFSSTSSNDSTYYTKKSKLRCSSYCAPIEIKENQTLFNLEDEVFTSTSTTDDSKNKFVALLRKHSLDSCVSIFEKHEIDMDLFLTLTKHDLELIGVDWDKRDAVLDVIYQLNKQK